MDQSTRLLLLHVMFLFLFLHQYVHPICCSLNAEVLALLAFRERVVTDPLGALSKWKDDGGADSCAWLGVQCSSDGKVLALNLEDFCLGGTLAPELGNLVHVKAIIMRNNSFSGNIPKEIGKLKQLQVLDLGYNNLSGPIPSDLVNNHILTTLLTDNNELLDKRYPEIEKIRIPSEFQDDDENNPTSLQATWGRAQTGSYRRLLQIVDNTKLSKAKTKKHDKGKSHSSPLASPSVSPAGSPTSSSAPESSISFPPVSLTPSASPSLSPSPAPASFHPADPPIIPSSPSIPHSAPRPSPAAALTPNQIVDEVSKSKHISIIIASGVIGGFLFIFASAVGIFACRRGKLVKPWATGLSGQLQKALVAGVPQLNRSELETACEDFSNIIGYLSDGKLYKGTLSSGVEIAVASREDWSKKKDAQFRNKIDQLSKVNHKNFVNLIGYCQEKEPFTRMMVFEYAPNGTLFEHLHIKETEILDWQMRLRIIMGIAYCLEHMHQLVPAVIHENLQSSSVYLAEDYAAKVSDFSFWNELTASKMGSEAMGLLETASADAESNVFSFGVILFEIITGKLPYSFDCGHLMDCASYYVRDDQFSKELVDPTLTSFKRDELGKLLLLVKDCVHADPKQRPTMKEVTARLKEITGLGPDGATPKLSPLWWAELEISSSEAS